MTARLTSSPRWFCATSFTSRRMSADTCSSVTTSFERRTAAAPSAAAVSSYGKRVARSCTTSESYGRPTSRLPPKTVWRGFVSACPLASWPTTSRWRVLSATMEGTVCCPSRDGMTYGLPSLTIAAHELVVPRSMPIT